MLAEQKNLFAFIALMMMMKMIGRMKRNDWNAVGDDCMEGEERKKEPISLIFWGQKSKEKVLIIEGGKAFFIFLYVCIHIFNCPHAYFGKWERERASSSTLKLAAFFAFLLLVLWVILETSETEREASFHNHISIEAFSKPITQRGGAGRSKYAL